MKKSFITTANRGDTIITRGLGKIWGIIDYIIATFSTIFELAKRMTSAFTTDIDSNTTFVPQLNSNEIVVEIFEGTCFFETLKLLTPTFTTTIEDVEIFEIIPPGA